MTAALASVRPRWWPPRQGAANRASRPIAAADVCLAADSEISRDLRLFLACRDAAPGFGDIAKRYRRVSAAIDPTLRREGDSLTLTFTNQGALELGKGSMTESMRLANGRPRP
jgi:hypothetical protein